MWRTLVVSGVVCSFSPAAHAQDQAPLTGNTVRVRIVTNNPQRYFPVAAQRAGIEGDAAALCDVSPEGSLTNCAVQSESPTGYGFGDAIVRVSEVFRIAPKADDGTPTAGRQFLLQMHFRLPAR